MPFVTIKYPDFYHVRHILLYLKWCVKIKEPYLWLAFQSPYNSVDLRSYPSASSTTNHVTYEEGNAVAEQHGSIYCETSALHAEGVTECFNLSVSTRGFFYRCWGKCSFIFFHLLGSGFGQMKFLKVAHSYYTYMCIQILLWCYRLFMKITFLKFLREILAWR